MNIKERIYKPEIMDTEKVPLSEMKKALGFLEITNRFFGGNAVVQSFLEQASKRWYPNQTITLLDVGTGLGDIPLFISKWAIQRGWTVHITGIDIVSDICALAQEKTKTHSNITILQKDLRDLNEENKKFDYVISSLFLHHVDPNALISVLVSMDNIATRGMLASDLQRNLPSYWSVWLLSKLIGNRVVQNDGPLSVQRAFQLNELENLAKDAHLSYLKAHKQPWFRLSLSGEK